MPKHINALFCLKKKRAARTKDRSLHRVPIRACGKSACRTLTNEPWQSASSHWVSYAIWNLKNYLSPFDVVHYCILQIQTTCFDRSNPTMLAFVHGLVFCFLFVVDWWPKEKNSYWLPNSTQIWFTSKSVLTQK